VCTRRPGANAWHARRRSFHQLRLFVALLASGAAGLCPRSLPAQANGRRVYETVVTAKPAQGQAPREDRAAASTVITQDRTPRAAESVTELLSEQAGGNVTRLGGLGATATLSLRGSTPNQVLVYLDGVPLNTPTGGGVDLGAIPLGDVERIEIYRGQSPIGFGASAIGGVVSLTTAVPKAKRIDLEVGGGSFGTSYASVREAGSRGPLHLYAGAHALRSRGDFPYLDTSATNWRTADDEMTRRRNNDLHQLDSMLRVVADLPGARRLSASAMLFARSQGLPGQSTVASPDARLGTLRATGTIAYEANGDSGPGGRLRATAYGNYLWSHFADPNERINALATDARDSTYTAGGTVDWRRAVRSWLTVTTVLDGRYDRFVPSDALAPRSTGSPGTRLFGAAGSEVDFWARALRLDVIPSLRLEAAREATSGRDAFYAFRDATAPVAWLLPVARLSLIEEALPWLSLRANGGRYARLPSLVELYGNNGYLLGAPGLLPEHGLNVDVGPVVSLRRERATLSWSTALFASLASDLISYRIGNGRARPENVGSARILGIESSLDLELGPHARLQASATLTDARDTTSRPAYHDRQLPLRPRYRFYARPEWRAVALGPSFVLGLYADVDATAGNYLESTNLTPVAARLLLGAGVYASLPDGFRLRLSARNLGDTHTNDFANYPLPGRELYVTLTWSSAKPPTKE
jgi:outer membrane receptor protein involved in Fe transport